MQDYCNFLPDTAHHGVRKVDVNRCALPRGEQCAEARMKCCFYATAVLGIFKASREIKCKECALKECTM